MAAFFSINNKAIVDVRLRSQSGAAPYWIGLSIRRGVKSLLLYVELYFEHINFFASPVLLAIICKHDVVR